MRSSPAPSAPSFAAILLLPLLLSAGIRDVHARQEAPVRVDARAEILSAEAIEAYIAQLRHAEAGLRARAACHLEDAAERLDAQGRRGIVDVLVAQLGDDAAVPMNICTGIGKRKNWGNGICDGEVSDACPGTTPGRKAAAALTDLGTYAREQIESRVDSEGVHVRLNAAWALGAIGSPQSIPALEIAVHDADPEVRNRAAWALGAIGHDRGTAPLVVLLRDEEGAVRERAAWALGAIGDDRAIDGLLDVLGDDSAEVRERAAWALGAIGDARATDGLLTLTEDENADVRKRAFWALRVIM